MIDLTVLEQLDKSWTLAINSLNSPFTDRLWTFFSGKLEWVPLYMLVIALLIYRLGWKKGLLMILTAVLCILCVDQFANLIKHTAERLRPGADPEMISRGLHVVIPSKEGSFGFFSAHAGNAMAFAVCSFKALKMGKQAYARPWKGLTAAYGWFITIWAILVGASRIFVAKHFLGDVLVGFAVGLLFAEILCGLARILTKIKPETT